MSLSYILKNSYLFTKQNPIICWIQETHLKVSDSEKIKRNGWETVYHEITNNKESGMAILIVNKIEFRPKGSKCDKDFYNAKNLNSQWIYNSLNI